MKSYQILIKCFSLDLYSPSTKRSDSYIDLSVSKTFLLKGRMCVGRVGLDCSFLRAQALWRVLLTTGELVLWESAV